MLHYFAMLKVGRIQFDRLNIMWIKRHDWVDNRQASGKLSPHTPWLCETQRRPPSLVGGPPTRGRHTCYMHTHTHTHTHTQRHTYAYTHTHTHRHDCQCRYKAIKRSVIIIKNMFIWPFYVHAHSVCVCVHVYRFLDVCSNLISLHLLVLSACRF